MDLEEIERHDLSVVHRPALFGLTPKYHICKVGGEWRAFFPANWPMPADAYLSPLGVWLRKMNNIAMWQPSSFCVAYLETRLQ